MAKVSPSRLLYHLRSGQVQTVAIPVIQLLFFLRHSESGIIIGPIYLTGGFYRQPSVSGGFLNDPTVTGAKSG